MIALEDYQFSLIPDIRLSDEFVFGLDQTVEIEPDGWDVGTAEWVTQDGTNPINGASRFGNDQLTGPTHSFSLYVNKQEDYDALAELALMQKAWLYGAKREPGKIAAIRYQVGGRTRMFYGRPRAWSPVMNNDLINGMIKVEATFKAADALYYDDVWGSTSIPFIETSAGGIILPATLPISSMPPGETNGNIYVAGDHEAYPIARFVGPIENPSLQWGNTKLALNYDVPELGWVEIDARPWIQTVVTNDGRNIPGALARRVYLQDMLLPPGPVSMNFRGNSSTGTATAEVSWQPARVSL